MRPIDDGWKRRLATGVSGSSWSPAAPPAPAVCGSSAPSSISSCVDGVVLGGLGGVGRGRDEAREVPARRGLLQPLLGQVGILGARSGADEVAAEGVDDLAASIDRFAGLAHGFFPLSISARSPTVWLCHFDV